VSDNSLDSKYCIERELRTAVQRGIPVIPVVLCKCPWEEQPLPGDVQERRLGALGALPKDENFTLLPVKNWPDRNAAWNSVVDQIAQALLAMAGSHEPPAQMAARPSAPAVPPLLPYFCDQGDVERGFNHGIKLWRQSALLVLIKGTLEDRPPKFWERLCAKNLADYVSATREAQVLEQRPLAWPSAWDGARVLRGLEADVLHVLSDSLTGNKFRIDTSASLAAKLEELDGVLPLIAGLPDEPIKALSASLCALLNLIEACPEHAPLDRLVIAFIVESDQLIQYATLAKKLKLSGFARTQVLELDRLEELTPEDVRFWHREHQVNRYCRHDEEGIVAHIFQSVERIRLGPFATRLKPLLGL
jgi:hypothetical protein